MLVSSWLVSWYHIEMGSLAGENELATDRLSQNRRTRVLLLAGSPTSLYYYRLSLDWAIGCDEANKEANKDKYTFLYAVIDPDGPAWCFPNELTDDAIGKAIKMSPAAGVAMLTQMLPDACVSHLCCYTGMVSYLSLVENICNIPLVGSNGTSMTLSVNKALARSKSDTD